MLLFHLLTIPIGKIINQIDQVIRRQYTSNRRDQDNIGETERDFGKSNFFEESVGIPCIISGPKIPKGKPV